MTTARRIRRLLLRSIALAISIICLGFILFTSDVVNLIRGGYGYHLQRLQSRGPVTEETAAAELKAMEERHMRNEHVRLLAALGMFVSVMIALQTRPSQRREAPVDPQKGYDY